MCSVLDEIGSDVSAIFLSAQSWQFIISGINIHYNISPRQYLALRLADNGRFIVQLRYVQIVTAVSCNLI